MTKPTTHKGLPIYVPAAGPDAATHIGTDKDGNDIYFELLSGQESFVTALENPTSVEQKQSYTHKVGSTIGFSQKIGMAVEVSGGIDLGVVSFGAKVNASGELGFSQAFSDLKEHSVQLTIPSGKQITVTEGTLTVQYWILNPVFLPGTYITPCYVWDRLDKDVIDTGAYFLEETDLS